MGFAPLFLASLKKVDKIEMIFGIMCIVSKVVKRMFSSKMTVASAWVFRLFKVSKNVIVSELASIYIVKVKPRVLPIYESEQEYYWRRIDEVL